MTTKYLRLRKARINDSRFISRLQNRSFLASWSQNDLRVFLKNPHNIIAIAQYGYGKSPCGYIMLQRILDEAEVMSFAVLPRFRCQGLGKKLLRKSLTYARLKSIRSVSLEVCENNFKAQKLYKYMGFCVRGFRKDYYVNSSAFIMIHTQ